uniref:L1 transposable element RRM domain-containing protein n=1 Tax=Astyanax mexicanus TaxID=7994 RepID=A0A8B9HH37_ASTMX
MFVLGDLLFLKCWFTVYCPFKRLSSIWRHRRTDLSLCITNREVVRSSDSCTFKMSSTRGRANLSPVSSPIKKKSKQFDSMEMSKMADLEDSLQKQAACLQSQFEAMGADLKMELSKLKDDFSAQTKSVLAMVAKMDKVVAEQHEQKKILNSHTAQLEATEAKLAELEDRSRRSNVRLVGLLEGSEGDDPVGYIQKAIKSWFPSLAHKEMEIERAHRIYRKSKDGRNTPRVFIFKFLRYQDRQSLLKASRLHDPVVCSGSRLRFFVDYNAATARKREAFLPVQRALKAAGVENFLIYPAILKVNTAGTAHTFSTPQEAKGLFSSIPRRNELEFDMQQ